MRTRWICVILCLHYGIVTSAMAVAQDGADGSHGHWGAPGDGGGRGGDADSKVWERVGFGKPFYWFGFGFDGGRGGNGGDGFIPNANPDDTAAGGQGGHGGRGGDVEAIWSARVSEELFERENHVEAIGGAGGASGRGGLGFQGGLHGESGFGGAGGAAHALAQAGFLATARAVGGRGGDADGLGGHGGQGGTASVAVILTNPKLHRELFYESALGTINAVGGDGGLGFNGAHGGHGGRSLIGGNINNFLTQSDEFHYYLMRAIGRGGNGGSSSGGNGGIGGHVFADLASLQDGSRFLNGEHEGDYKLNGGHGGHSIAHPQIGGHGGEGGSILVANGLFSATSTGIRITAVGGQGGDALGKWGGNGGRGGAIVFTPLRLGRSQSINLELRGGNGGHSQSGHGGDGRTVAAVNPLVEGENSLGGPIQLVVRGGNGGNLLGEQTTAGDRPRRAGDGGHARAVLNDAFPKFEYTNILVHAVGGWAGTGLGNSGPERAGNAFAEARQSSGQSIFINALAEGGRSVQRINGNAVAIADVNVGGENILSARGRATATARPFQYSNNTQPYPLAVIGGNAYAEAKMVNRSSQSSADAVATAEGGFGTLHSGWSQAVALAVNDQGPYVLAPNVTATATARSRADSSSSSANNAMSLARAEGYSYVIAESTARAEGQYNYGHAVAEFYASRGRGRATAVAQGETTQWAHRSNVSATALARGYVSNFEIDMNASAYTSFRQTNMPAPTPHSAWNHVLINPRRPAVDSFTESSTLIDQMFDFGDRSNHVGNILALGQIGGGLANSDQSRSEFEVANRFELTVDLFPMIQDSDDLYLSLFNPTYTGNGFDFLSVTFDYEGVRVLDASFSDLTSAHDFFQDRVIPLDDLVAADGLERQFDLRFDLRYSKANDSFGFDFLIGSQNRISNSGSFSSVPEPSTLLLLMIASAGCLLRRRQRSNWTADSQTMAFATKP